MVRSTGAGGPSDAQVTLVVPMPVYPTSCENRHRISVDDPTIPSMGRIPGVVLEPGESGVSGPTAIAFTDFRQDGTHGTAITATSMYKGVYTDGSNPDRWSDSPAKLYFLHRDPATGRWSDVSSRLIPDTSSRYICISVGYLEVADLNNDGRPDVFVSCTGPDYPIVSQGNRFMATSLQ